MNDTLQIPGYTIHNVLGEGGMATVYLATQKSLHRKVALKLLRKTDNKKFNERFIREGQFIASLNHPNIITIYNIAKLKNGHYYIAMEYLEGGDLTKYRDQAVDPQLALSLIKQIAEGLTIVHKKGIIHRDIKPANILYRDENTVVLSDFGIAKDLTKDLELTQVGITVGSPIYSSPEQSQGENLDPRSDIYSLGVVFLELLLGENPFRGKSFSDTAIRHIKMPIPTLPEHLKLFQPLINKMLAKEPGDRFASCDELIQEIRQHALYFTNHASTSQIDRTIQIDCAPNTPSDQHDVQLKTLASKKIKQTSIFLTGIVAVAMGIFALTYESETERKINEFLEQAEQKITENKLISPESDNARYFYNQVLLMDAENKEALKGIEEVRKLRIERYLKLAATRFEEKALYHPKEDNAQYYYQVVLQLDPENDAAAQGMKLLIEEHTRLAKLSFASKNYRQGMRHVKNGLELDPENEELLALRKKYANSSNPIKRFINKLI
ncbi:serine/threonine-protein kinase [Teredinibacter sp. KSP-S5-2]|uniref:serine/threonine protein kinase n=1 Tax=Teredinibacter sp. KSP-S5-2 TaxID=3034506 RepID=UPI002934D95B|nr:serine/threonine-protein kinase [Teredinibacter sp. KSP-S5-2]WNO10008.1 serine/threonine-protein kinase [Teredinibacter sp. KSP-S5-2]